jgi:cellulose synthase/poly-beta-1,6-N-acetylglucosamine synthase-like glycosyltransferase
MWTPVHAVSMPAAQLLHQSHHPQTAVLHCSGAKIGYCSQLISSEEAPVTEKTLRKQRLRWAQGWFEVSLKHLFSLMTSRHTSMRQKLGFFTLLFFRELFVYLTFHPIILVVIYVIRDPGSLAVQLLFLITGAPLMYFPMLASGSIILLRSIDCWL